MIRVSAFAVLVCAAITFSVSNVNGQCASCNQGSPVFAQGYAQSYAPVQNYVATQTYAAPQQYSSYAPVSSGCSSCAQGIAQTYTAMPYTDQSSGCCGSAVGYSSAPVSYAAPVSTGYGCSSCNTCNTCNTCDSCNTYQPRRSYTRVIRGRRGNNCNTCNSCY